MNITSYADFIDAVNRQPEPQRLLFVFVESELPTNPTAHEKEGFHARQGGTLNPVMCVDKLPSELRSFTMLVEESTHMRQPWDIVFAAALSGQGGIVPPTEAAEQSFRKMIDAIERGAFGNFLAFNRNAELLHFS